MYKCEKLKLETLVDPCGKYTDCTVLGCTKTGAKKPRKCTLPAYRYQWGRAYLSADARGVLAAIKKKGKVLHEHVERAYAAQIHKLTDPAVQLREIERTRYSIYIPKGLYAKAKRISPQHTGSVISFVIMEDARCTDTD